MLVAGQAPQDSSLEAYSVKSCKYNLLPSSLASRAYSVYTGEVEVHDVFGLPSTTKQHVIQLSVPTDSLLTLSAEVHRDTPTTLTVDIYRRGEAGKANGRRVLYGKSLLGAGGEDTKSFLHGLLGERDREVDIVFQLASVGVASSQVDSRVAEAKCWPIRLDLTAVPTSRAALHWPTSCPSEDRLPKALDPSSTGSQMVVLGDSGLASESVDLSNGGQHFVFRFADERPWANFERALWSGALEVPPRLHRFVRFFLRVSFRFASGPLQLVIELFDLKETPDGTATAPKCALGCLGGVPVYNGQLVDHAMPTGFRYKLWLLAANMAEWTEALPDTGRHCLEFDFDYSARYEQRLTPFEVGPAAWMCEYSRLPTKILQSSSQLSTEKLASQGGDYVGGRSIWIRDRFGFPPDEVEDMEHDIEIEVSEACVFRATTHHSDGVDVFVALMQKDSSTRVCQTMKHPGPVPRQTIFCILQPGSYKLTFFAEYPLGGLHPCSDFFAQVALRPLALAGQGQTEKCLASASDLTGLKVQRTLALTTVPKWQSIKVPIQFDSKPTTTKVWGQSLTVSEEDAAHRVYLRMVLHSDYVSSDLRFQVQYNGKQVADNQVTAHGYADMMGPLDPGTYNLYMYYVTGVGPPSTKLCSTSMIDLRLVSRSSYENRTAQWMCTSTRVPLPDSLTPQADEQIRIDSEYVVPSSGFHSMIIQIDEPRLLRIHMGGGETSFRIDLRDSRDSLVAKGTDNLEATMSAGTYTLKLNSFSKAQASRDSAACMMFTFNLLLHPVSSLPLCPWAPSSSDQSAVAVAQRQAADHIGSVLLDLVPKKLSKDLNIKPPVTLWMAPGMEKSFDMQIDSTSAFKLDATVHPPFLPLEIFLRRKRESGKLEAPVGVAEWTESRLLLLYNDLPPGSYVLEFKQSRRYLGQPALDLPNLCAHVTVSAEVGLSSKEAVNTMRSELLDLPDILAVQPVPSSWNTVGWLASGMIPVVGTQVYRFGEGGGKTSLKLEEKSILRIISEPADLSNADIEVELNQNGQRVTQSDELGQLVAEIPAGTYELVMKPKANAPFLVTVGMATESRIRQDLALSDSGRPCTEQIPDMTPGATWAASGWTIGPSFFRLGGPLLRQQGLLTKFPINVLVGSILYIEAGSSMPLDLVRIAISVPEGLWVGEQRGLRNSLEIELPPGTYEIQLGQPKPSTMDDIKRCLDFSVLIRATPINPDSAADASEAASAAKAVASGAVATGAGKQELGAREEALVDAAPCFSMGTLPLPLDISNPGGGSQILGGPLDANGRLLIRASVMLTDMHDGRKKVYMKTGDLPMQLKLGVILGGYSRLSLASQVSFTVMKPRSPAGVDPLEVWTMDDGWERIYMLEPSTGYWLSFHHPHRERSESACLHFGLMLEAHPLTDIDKMLQCGGASISPSDMFPTDLDAQGILADATATLRYARPLSYIKQEQLGFLIKMRFTLKHQSWIGAEVGYNFFSSHAEMDIAAQEDENQADGLVSSELDALHKPGSATNARLTLGVVLPPGDYVLRVADDHYRNQLRGQATACFPYSFEVRIVPEATTSPGVLSVSPHPSVPLVRGVDLVMTLRFSEPPRGSVKEVVAAFSLGGMYAQTGGSMHDLGAKFADSFARKTTVQASASEGHRVWVIGWNSQVLAGMDTAQLKIASWLRGNTSKKVFKFNPPSYTIVDAPRGTPWSGGAESGLSGDASSSPSVPAKDGEIRSEGGSASRSSAQIQVDSTPKAEGSTSGGSASGAGVVGEMRPEGSGSSSSSSGDNRGEIRVEGGGASRDAPPPPPDDGNDAPKVEEWTPMDEPSVDFGRKNLKLAPSKTTSEPSGYRWVMLASLGSLAVVGAFFASPKLRRGGDPRNVSSRFRDIGARSNEEGIGLMDALGGRYDDDDML
ncbi:unnamed protein product [Polarella glacialis]|uniref:Uncharacterized protein n=1 Tax=Polarella glacialis TaxID=89957 RepID=A0A813HG48_POLGL|nr:unnamed protein product [Polarella glacialis]